MSITEHTHHHANTAPARLRTGSAIAGIAAMAAGAPALVVTGSPAVGALIAVTILACVAAAAVMI
ncbi:hypothetical protein FXW78_54190 [Rhodococcus opacus]|nr:hypothetical protein [Rhodococcus opacus]